MSITPAEQLLIEMINRARLDPEAEAERYGVDLNSELLPGQISSEAKQALSPNALLHLASDVHGQWMLDEDVFSHTGENGSSPRDRMAAAGYSFESPSSAGENITYRGSTGSIDTDRLMEVHHHRDFFLSAGHRANMMSESYKELGVSQLVGVFTSNGTDFNASMVTENFASSGSGYFVTGVAYSDLDQDGFYSIGEGTSGTEVTVDGQTVATAAAGGYGVAVDPSSSVAVTLGGISLEVDALHSNVKLDLVDGTHVLTSGSTVLLSAAGSLTVLGYVAADLTGHEGDDTLVGNRNDNTLTGLGGDDTLQGGEGDDVMFGGAGSDRAVFEFDRAEAEIEQMGDGSLTITSGEFVDRAYEIELFSFADGDFTLAELDVSASNQVLIGASGVRDDLVGGLGDDVLMGDGAALAFMGDAGHQMYRIYQSMLGREPDVSGIETWVQSLFLGEATLSSAIEGFISSAEFTQRFGVDLDDRSFISLLYSNVLDRDASDAELDAWQARLDGGDTRADLVLGFSESGEFVNRTSEDANAFLYEHTDSYWTGIVYRLYQATLGRDPDADGFEGWISALSAGDASYETVPNGFIASAEFQATYGALDDDDFVALLYQNVLSRSPDDAGLNGWLDAMEGGLSRADVVQGFAQSAEFKTATEQELLASVRAELVGDTLGTNGGNDVLIGGYGADTFEFDADFGGDHVIMDFEAWDFIALQNFGYADADEALAQFSQVGDAVVFLDGSTSVTLEDTDLSVLTDLQLNLS